MADSHIKMIPKEADVPPTLDERHRIEEAFHDRVAREATGDFYDFGALDIPDAYLHAQLGDLRGKLLVEIGCGDGRNTVSLREQVPTSSLDISAEMVAVTSERARAEGLESRISARQCSIEELDLPELSCDVVYGHSVLHHLDLDLAIPRIANVLKPGGLATFLDPLDHNPILNFMRKLTPAIRTPTEKPISLADIAKISKYFSHARRREFHFLSLAAFFWYYGIRNERCFRATLAALSRVDGKLFDVAPLCRRFSWVTVMTFVK